MTKITSQEYLTYNPKLAIRSCLIASKKLIDNSSKSFHDNETEYKKFLKSVESLREELEICFQALSNFDNGEKELIIMNNKYNRLYKEMISYRNDNKKLFDNNVQLYNIHQLLKKEKEYLYKCLYDYLNTYVNSKGIPEKLLQIVNYTIKLMYSKNDLIHMNKRIDNIKANLTNDDIDGIILLRNLENDKENLEQNIELMIQNKNELEENLPKKEEKIDEINII